MSHDHRHVEWEMGVDNLCHMTIDMHSGKEDVDNLCQLPSTCKVGKKTWIICVT